MKTFFDFLFYGLYSIYSKEEKGAGSSAAAIIGGLLAMNLVAIFMFASTYFPNLSFVLNKLVIVIVFLIFQIITYLIYVRRDSLFVIQERWKVKSDSSKVWFRLSLAIYAALSVFAFLGLAIYLGSK